MKAVNRDKRVVDEHHRVDELIYECGHPDCFKQQEARFELEHIGEPAVEQLIAALRNADNPTIRWRVAEVLGTIGDPSAIEPLIGALKDEDLSVRWRAIEALGDIGEPAIEALKESQKDENEDVRWGASRALKDIESRRTLQEKEKMYRKIGENIR